MTCRGPRGPGLRTGFSIRFIGPRVAAGVLLSVAGWELPLQLQELAGRVGWAPGSDFAFYRGVAQRWLETGSFYLPAQLAGPYGMVLNRDVLYPPTALYLFTPFLWLPPAVWWGVPIFVLCYALWRWRPAAWAWPILAFGLVWPRTQGALLLGNTDLWIAAAVAGGLLWGWPAILAALKPTFLALALVGATRRSWWIGWTVFAAINVPLLGLWSDYLVTLGNSGIPWTYSLLNVVLPLLPLAAWLARVR